MIIVTTEQIQGHSIKQTLGLVLEVREFGMKRPTKPIYEVIEALKKQAEGIGANAIIGFRLETLDNSEVKAIVAYGTAVVL